MRRWLISEARISESGMTKMRKATPRKAVLRMAARNTWLLSSRR
jgi:hypothetical protein